MPKVSVIMPAYNAEKYIAEAIDSILAQTYTDYEFIIINDCSTDRTEEIILSFKDSRIVYLKNEENMGVAKTLNRGLSVARGEYIARMDADDISLPERFEKQIQYLDAHKDVAVLGTALVRFGTDIVDEKRSFSTDCRQMKTDMFFSCGLAHPSVMMRRKEILELGGYDAAYNGMEDYALWCRVCKSYCVTTLPETLLRYRIHTGQVTKNPSAEHQKRMHVLKAGLLEDLHLPTEGALAESFYLYSLGKLPNDVQSICDFLAFLESVITANQKNGCYDVVMMSDVVRTVALNAVGRLSLRDALYASRKTILLKPANVLAGHMKQRVKQLFKR